MGNEARMAGVPPRRVHLVVSIDRLLARLLDATPAGSWVVKGGYANQLRRPAQARFTEDLDLVIGAEVDRAPTLLAAAFACDLGDGFAFESTAVGRPLGGPPGGGLRFAVLARLGGSSLDQFKVDVSGADVPVAEVEECVSDPVVDRLGFPRSRIPVLPVSFQVAEKIHALTLPRGKENSRARDLVDLVWFVERFAFRSDTLIESGRATFERRATHSWPPAIPLMPASWTRPYDRWRGELTLGPVTPRAARELLIEFFRPVFEDRARLAWDPGTQKWSTPGEGARG